MNINSLNCVQNFSDLKKTKTTETITSPIIKADKTFENKRQKVNAQTALAAYGVIPFKGNNLEEKNIRIINRNLIGRYRPETIEGLALFDDDVFFAMEEKGFLDKYLINPNSKHKVGIILSKRSISFNDANNLYGNIALRMQKTARFALDIKPLNKKSSVDELSTQEKRQLYKGLISANTDIFANTNFIKILAGHNNFIPSNLDEYSNLLNSLSSSTDVKFNPISDKTISEFYTVLESLDDKNGDFYSFDFANGQIELSYSRKDFISDIDKELSDCSENEKSIICRHFGF